MDGARSIKRNVILRDGYGNRSEIDIIYTPSWPPFFALPRYVECKNYSFPVPFEMVAKFKSVLELNKIPLQQGLFITTSTFTPRATTVGIKTMDGTALDAWKRAVLAKQRRKKRFLFLSKFILGLLVTSGILTYTAASSNTLSPSPSVPQSASSASSISPSDSKKHEPTSSQYYGADYSSSETSSPSLFSSLSEKLALFPRPSASSSQNDSSSSRNTRKNGTPSVFVPLSKMDGWMDPPVAERYPAFLKDHMPTLVLHWIYLQHAEIEGSYEWGMQNVLRDRVKLMEKRLTSLRERLDSYYTKGYIEQTSSQWLRKLRRETTRDLLPRGKKPSTIVGLVAAGSGGAVQAFQDLRLIIQDLFFP